MTAARRLAAGLIVATLAWQLFWHLRLAPPEQVSGWAMATFFSLPIFPALVLVLVRHRHAPFWGAVASLFYFSHGVMEAWSRPEVRGLAITEALLAAALVVAASWDGLQARLRRPRA